MANVRALLTKLRRLAVALLVAASVLSLLGLIGWLLYWLLLVYPEVQTEPLRNALKDGDFTQQKDMQAFITTLRKDVVTTIATVIGGIGFFGGLFYTARNYRATQDRQVTERFAKAVEQLGARVDGKPVMELRLGGIYSLEKIAHEYASEHWLIMEVLAAYVRTNSEHHSKPSSLPRLLPPEPPEPATVVPATEDVVAVVRAIGRRTRKGRDEPGRIVLSKAYLARANLSGAHLMGADLSEAILRDAILSGADLIGAHLIGADLSEAILREAHLEKADLRWANLSWAILIGAHLTGAHLTGAHLTGADLSGAHLEKADLSGAHLTGANLDRAYLSGANLDRAYLGLVNLYEADLSEADLREAHLSDANLAGANLSGADLSDANLTRAELSRADLSRAKFFQARLLFGAQNHGRNAIMADVLREQLDKLVAELHKGEDHCELCERYTPMNSAGDASPTAP